MLETALDGVTVLDFGQLIAAPVCGMWLTDFGATVIKIEALDGELARHLGPPSVNGESIVQLASNRNKLGLALDLKHPAAAPLLRKAMDGVDVVLHNFRPGVADRLGIGWEALSAVNPDLIYCAISAFGQTSEWRQRPGVDGIIQAASGIMSTMESTSGPGKVPLPLADMTGAMFAAMSILAALHRRDAGHGGAYLDIDLFGGMMMLQHLNLAAYLTLGEQPVPSGSAASYAAPNEAFPTADGWIMLAAYQPERWAALCQVLGHNELTADPRFAANRDRVDNRVGLHSVLDPLFRTHSSDHWMEVLSAADLMVTKVADYSEVVRCAGYCPDRVEISMHHSIAGEIRMPGFAFSNSQRKQRPAPRLGEHSREALSLLGFSDSDIAGLISSGAVRECMA